MTGMRFGVRLGPFWVSTSTRRGPRRSQSFQGVVRDENGNEHRCQHKHRTLEAAEECARRENRRRDEAAQAAEARRLGGMSAEEYRRHLAESDPLYEDRLRREETAIEAETDAALQKMKNELAEVNFQCKACGNDGYEVLSGELGVGMVVRCTSCGSLHRASKEAGT